MAKSTSNFVERSEEVDCCGCGEEIPRSPEVVLPFSEAGVHFMLTKPCSSREEGVAGNKNNLKYQWVVEMSSGMAHSRVVFMGKRFHVPRRREYRCHGNEVARGSLRWGKNAIFRASGGGKTTSNLIG